MCYGVPCMFWKGDKETCAKPFWEDCPELLAQDAPPEAIEDETEQAEAVMDFLRGLLAEARRARKEAREETWEEAWPCDD